MCRKRSLDTILDFWERTAAASLYIGPKQLTDGSSLRSFRRI
jgi:hypothetical protein